MIRKTIPLVTLIACALVITALSVQLAAAQGGSFSDTFEDPELPGWEHSPEVIVSAGVMRLAPGNFAHHPAGGGDLDLSLILRFDPPGETEIHYRASDAGSYALVFTPDRLILLKPGGPGVEPLELAGADLGGFSTRDWFNLRITQNGGQHTVSLNDDLWLQAEDPEPRREGGLTLFSHGERTTEVEEINLLITPTEPRAERPRPEAEPVAVPAAESPETDSWAQFLERFSASGSQGSTFDLGTIALNLVLAVITSFILSRVYIYWGASLSNRRKFAANFMLVTVTTTFIILVVRSSVALSLGLVGALSIIRFRAAIKEPEELAYLFFAISLGIGFGDNQRTVTLLTMLVVILVLGLARLLRQSQADVNLNLSIASRSPDKVDMQQVMAALEKHAAKLRLIRYDENPQALEMSFVIEFRHSSDLNQARSALLALSDGLEISFMDNKGLW